MNLSIIKAHLVSGDTSTKDDLKKNPYFKGSISTIVKKNSHFGENIFTTALDAFVKVLFRTRLRQGKSPDPDPPRMTTSPLLVLPAPHNSFGS